MAKKFEIQKQGFPSVADAYNGLLGMDNNRVVNLPIAQLDEIDDQPFPINDSKVDQIADSMMQSVYWSLSSLQKTVTDTVSFRAGTVSGLVRSLAKRKYPVLSKTILLTIRQQGLSCLQRIPTETMNMLRQFTQEPMQNSLSL